MSTERIAKAVEAYVAARDRLKALTADYDAKAAKLKEIIDRLEVMLLTELPKGVESVKTVYGTVYRTTKKSASVADWTLVLKFVQDHGAWDMLTKGVNKAEVSRYIDDGIMPPGVNYAETKTVGVRRAAAKEA